MHLDPYIVERLRADGPKAKDLHERSRAILLSAVQCSAVRVPRTAGLSQLAIAEAIGRSQPEVSRLLRFQERSALGRRLSHRSP